jgi:hypothetical protein
MKTLLRKTCVSLMMVLLIGLGLGNLFPAEVIADEASSNPVNRGKSNRFVIVGDTGIGERGYNPGFMAVTEAMQAENPDVLIHLGDFVYQPKIFPASCDSKYVDEIRQHLVEPFPRRIFVPGDNDLPPVRKKPKASGCWEQIDAMDLEFDAGSGSGPKPRAFEGTTVIGNTFIAVLNAYPWKDPTEWLKPRIGKARAEGHWIIIATHLPPITSAWYYDRSQAELKQINALKPDLVFSGNQHSYERFYPLGLPDAEGVTPASKGSSSSYKRGEGAIHIVSGGGGAMLRPFADLRGKGRVAPDHVQSAVAKRAVANHFVLLEISATTIKGTTTMLCPDPEDQYDSNYRWKKTRKTPIECDGKEQGKYKIDEFEIVRE